MLVNIKKLKENAILPRYMTPGAAAADLYACLENDLTLAPGERAAVPTGIAISPERTDIVALIFGRSGIGIKNGVTLANSVGVVDSDYRGEIRVCLINHGAEPFNVHGGDRIAQIMFVPIETAAFVLTEELDGTERGEGGFGSTGVSAG